MIIVKPIVTLLLFIQYTLFLGMFTFGVTFPDDTSICYDGWLF